MARLTEEMVIARSKQSDLSAVKKLNCWGAELGDVSLLRRMPNVEVLAFSINKIRSLSDVAGCVRLRELYVRKNEIADLRELRHLRRLPHLTSLWLDENPCTRHPQYRLTVLRNLPNLERLDNVPVRADEVQEAMRVGAHIPDSDEEEEEECEQEQEQQYPPQSPHERFAEGGRASPECSPDRGSDRSCRAQPYQQSGAGSERGDASPESRDLHAQYEQSPPARAAASPPAVDARHDHPAMTRSQYDPRSPDGCASLRHSFSTHSVKEYSYSTNGECRYGGGGEVTSPQHHEPCCDRPERWDGYGGGGGGERACAEPWEREREREREYRSAVMGERRGFTRRPVARNSNLLSAVLCLIKELDYPSLEVAEMAVRCRMDELASGQ